MEKMKINSNPELEAESLESGNNPEANASEFKQSIDLRAEHKKAQEREKAEKEAEFDKLIADEMREAGINDEATASEFKNTVNPQDQVTTDNVANDKEIGGVSVGNLDQDVSQKRIDELMSENERLADKSGAANDPIIKGNLKEIARLQQDKLNNKDVDEVSVGKLDQEVDDIDDIMNRDAEAIKKVDVRDTLKKYKKEQDDTKTARTKNQESMKDPDKSDKLKSKVEIAEKQDDEVVELSDLEKKDDKKEINQTAENIKIHEDEIGMQGEATTEDLENPQPVFNEREEIKKAQEKEKTEEKEPEEKFSPVEGEGEIDRLDELKFKMEKAYAQLVKEQEHEATEWSKLSVFEKLKNKIGLGKKEGDEDKSNPEQIQWEYLTVKERVQRFKEDFSVSYEEYVRELMVKEKGEKGKDFIFSEPIMKGMKDGKETDITIFEDFNGKLKDLDRVRLDAMGKDKEGEGNHFSKFCIGAMKMYNKIPKHVRVAAIATAVGLVAGVSGGTAALGFAAAGKVTAASFLSALAIPVIGKGFNKLSDRDFDKTKVDIANGFSFSELASETEQGEGHFLRMVEDFNKREKKRGLVRIATTGIVVGGISYGLAGALDDFNSGADVPDSSGGGSDIPPINKEPVVPEVDPSNTPPVDKGPDVPEGIDPTGEGVEEIVAAGAENVEKSGQFSLEKGDTVWGELREHFGEDGKTAEAINEFRKETARELVANQNMTTEQANDFIKWRFENMDIGEDFSLDQNGDLKIDKFVTGDELNEFNQSSVRVEGSADDQDLAGERQSIDSEIDNLDQNSPETAAEVGSERFAEVFENFEIDLENEIDSNVWESIKDVKAREFYKYVPRSETVVPDAFDVQGLKERLQVPIRTDQLGTTLSNEEFDVMKKFSDMIRQDGADSLGRNSQITMEEFLNQRM